VVTCRRGEEAHRKVEADGQLEVKLDSRALEAAAQGIEDGDVNLGAVEGAVRRVQLWGQKGVKGGSEGGQKGVRRASKTVMSILGP
jgi:hypothetical protein